MKKSIIYLSLALALSVNAIAAETVTTFYGDTNPLCVAISKGDAETAKKIIEYGADVNEMHNGMTPLMVASRYNNVEMIEVLIAHGADVKAKDAKGQTALKYAEMSNANEAVAILKKASKK